MQNKMSTYADNITEFIIRDINAREAANNANEVRRLTSENINAPVRGMFEDDWNADNDAASWDLVYWPSDIAEQITMYTTYINDGKQIHQLMRDRVGMRDRLSAALYKKQITLID